MECFGDKCLCPEMCAINKGCIVFHELFRGFTKSVYEKIQMAKTSGRNRMVIDLLQKMQPPKVSGLQITRYYSLFRKAGINLDKDRITKRQMGFHQKFKSNETKKKRNDIHLKPDTVYVKRARKRIEKQQRLKELSRPIILPANIDEIVSKALSEPEPNFHYL